MCSTWQEPREQAVLLKNGGHYRRILVVTARQQQAYTVLGTFYYLFM